MLEGWLDMPAPAFPNYAAGSWGPEEAEELIQRDGRNWRRL
jgi:glucose-6-phosphate 1-dehydrogenase